MNTKRRSIILIVAVFVIAAVSVIATFPLWRPLFVNDVVDEAFPDLTDAQRDGIRVMPADQRDALVAMSGDNPQMANDTAAAMLEGDAEAAEAMPEMDIEPFVIAQGTFNQFDPIHRGEGTATIYELPEGGWLLRLEDFRTTNGPELHVVLSVNTPTSISEPLEFGYVDLGLLKGNIGDQNYLIPADVDLSRFSAVVIWCSPFAVNFTTAEITVG